MDRRTLVKTMSLMVGGSVAIPAWAEKVLRYPDQYWEAAPEGVSKQDMALLGQLADVIIPPTSTPGASAAGAHFVIPIILDDCYDPGIVQEFWRELRKLDDRGMQQFNQPFGKCTAEQKTAIVTQLQQDYRKGRDAGRDQFYFYKTAHDLITVGYFTSEKGMQAALAYLPIPGKHMGDIALEPGQKAWAL